MQQEDAQAISVLVAYLIYLPYVILYLTARWRIFRKMGRKGWEAIVPYYNVYVLFKVLYGNGWQMLLLLIPFYNIYVAFKLTFDLAYAFGKGGGFGLGLTFLSMIFSCILAFGKASFLSPVSDPVDALPPEPVIVRVDLQRSREAVKELRDLNWMREQGEIGQDLYEEVKSKLLRQI